MDISNLGLQETFRGNQWDYRPFVDIARDILMPIKETSGEGFRFFHSVRVFQLASQMRYYPDLSSRSTEVNWPLLKIAALFHDVGVRTIYDKHGFINPFDAGIVKEYVSNHAQLGVSVAREHLSSLLPAAELDEVCYLIANHSSKDANGNVPLMLLQDADNLDEKGVQHLYRMATAGCHHGHSLVDSCRSYFKRHTHPTEEVFDELHFASSKALARTRSLELRAAVLRVWHQTHGLDIP